MSARSSLVSALMGLVETQLAASDASVAMALLWMLRRETAQVREKSPPPPSPVPVLAPRLLCWEG